MNRVKYLDGKYMSWEETMEDFNESLKVKKAEEAYKTHLHNLQHGFPDKQQKHSVVSNNVVPPPPPVDTNNAAFQSNQSYQQFNGSNTNINSYPAQTSHHVPQFSTYQPGPPTLPQNQFQNSFSQFNQFNTNPNGFSFDNNNGFNGFDTNNFSFDKGSFNFDSNQFNNQFSNPDLFQSQNQFSNTFNNQFPGFGTNTFAPKPSFNKFNYKLPVNFNRIEGTIYEENPNMQY